MAGKDPLESALDRAFAHLVGLRTPPRLRGAMRHAVFPGGARVRPRVLLAVAQACHPGAGERAEPAAVAVELVHCASLVHDDLPCFDNAPIRRGRMSVHAKYGEALAVLVGDGLIVGAFEVLAHACARHPTLVPALGVGVAPVDDGVAAVRGRLEGADQTRRHRH